MGTTIYATNTSKIVDVEKLKQELEILAHIGLPSYAVNIINPGPNASVTFVNSLLMTQPTIALGVLDSHVNNKTPTTTNITSNLTVAQDFEADGTNTIISTTNLTVEDNVVLINSNVIVPYVGNSGIEINRGTGNQVAQLVYDETITKWKSQNGSGSASPLVTDVTLASATIGRNQLAAEISNAGKFLLNSIDGHLSTSDKLYYNVGDDSVNCDAAIVHLCGTTLANSKISAYKVGGTYFKTDGGSAGLFLNVSGLTSYVPIYLVTGNSVTVGSNLTTPTGYKSFLPGADYSTDTPIMLLSMVAADNSTVLNSYVNVSTYIANNGVNNWQFLGNAAGKHLLPIGNGTQNIGGTSNYISSLYARNIISNGAALNLSSTTDGIILKSPSAQIKTTDDRIRLDITASSSRLSSPLTSGGDIYIDNSQIGITLNGVPRITSNATNSYIYSPDGLKYANFTNSGAAIQHFADLAPRFSTDSTTTYLRSAGDVDNSNISMSHATYYSDPGAPASGIEVNGGIIFPGTNLSMRAVPANTYPGQTTNCICFYEGTNLIGRIDYTGYHTS